MKFAVQYSPELAELVDQNLVQVDLYKCPDWDDMVAEAQKQLPVYVHFPIVVGQNNIGSDDFQTIEGRLATTETRFVNAHIAPRKQDFPIDIGDEDVIAHVIDEVTVLTENFGAENVIVENIPYADTFIEGALDVATAPELFQQVIQKTGCGLLLDIAHAKLTCERAGHEIHEYLNAMPLNRLRELHVNGIQMTKNGMREDHMPMTPADWELFAWGLGQIQNEKWAKPHVITFEYGGVGPLFEWRSDKDALREQVPRLVDMISSHL